MIQWICKEEISLLKKDCIYYIDVIDWNFENGIFTHYIEIFDLNENYLGALWIDINKYFIKLAEFRNNRINQILTDE